MTKPKILIVDDDAEIRESLPNFCKLIVDAEVTVKANGSEAIATLDKEKFDLILQDLQMPGVDGFTVLNHAIKRYPEIRRIVLTGLTDPGVTKKVESLGAVYVSKPPQLKVLELIIKQELAQVGS